MPDRWYRKLTFMVPAVLLCAAIGGICLQLAFSDNAKLLPVGHIGDNISYTLIDSALYQIVIRKCEECGKVTVPAAAAGCASRGAGAQVRTPA